MQPAVVLSRDPLVEENTTCDASREPNDSPITIRKATGHKRKRAPSTSSSSSTTASEGNQLGNLNLTEEN